MTHYKSMREMDVVCLWSVDLSLVKKHLSCRVDLALIYGLRSGPALEDNFTLKARGTPLILHNSMGIFWKFARYYCPTGWEASWGEFARRYRSTRCEALTDLPLASFDLM